MLNLDDVKGNCGFYVKLCTWFLLIKISFLTFTFIAPFFHAIAHSLWHLSSTSLVLYPTFISTAYFLLAVPASETILLQSHLLAITLSKWMQQNTITFIMIFTFHNRRVGVWAAELISSVWRIISSYRQSVHFTGCHSLHSRFDISSEQLIWRRQSNGALLNPQNGWLENLDCESNENRLENDRNFLIIWKTRITNLNSIEWLIVEMTSRWNEFLWNEPWILQHWFSIGLILRDSNILETIWTNINTIHIGNGSQILYVYCSKLFEFALNFSNSIEFIWIC